jgi:hypothetical protein
VSKAVEKRSGLGLPRGIWTPENWSVKMASESAVVVVVVVVDAAVVVVVVVEVVVVEVGAGVDGTTSRQSGPVNPAEQRHAPAVVSHTPNVPHGSFRRPVRKKSSRSAAPQSVNSPQSSPL